MKSWEWGSNCLWRKQRCSLIGFWWHGSTIENEQERRKPEESSGDQHTTLTRLDSISPDHSFLFQTLLIISADLLLSSFPYSLDSQSWLNKCTVFNILLYSTLCCTHIYIFFHTRKLTPHSCPDLYWTEHSFLLKVNWGKWLVLTACRSWRIQPRKRIPKHCCTKNTPFSHKSLSFKPWWQCFSTHYFVGSKPLAKNGRK